MARTTGMVRPFGEARFAGLCSIPRRRQPGQLAEYAARRHICFPSLRRVLAFVLLEAMAAGKPIVANDASAILRLCRTPAWFKETIRNSAAAIEEMPLDPALRLESTRLGQARVAEFDSARVAECFSKRYGQFSIRRCVARSSRRRLFSETGGSPSGRVFQRRWSPHPLVGILTNDFLEERVSVAYRLARRLKSQFPDRTAARIGVRFRAEANPESPPSQCEPRVWRTPRSQSLLAEN